MNPAARALLVLGAGLGAATLAGLALRVGEVTGPEHDLRVNVLVGLMMVSVLLYLLAVRVVLRQALGRRALCGILGLAALLRAALLTAPPMLSSDIYRYVWDGRVQAAGINPYRYVPADPALRALRDAAVYPHINRRDYARTIYPPVAQLAYALVGVSRGGLLGMRLMMLASEVLAVTCLLAVLKRAALPRAHVLIYAWNPLPIWSFGSDGHVDALSIGLIGLALLLRSRRRPAAAGAALAAATLVKFFPLILAPALLRGRRPWRPALAGLLVVIGAYALYSGAGRLVLGFLPSYGHEEGLQSGGGLWLLAGLGEILRLPAAATTIYLAVAAAALALLALRVWRRRLSGSPTQDLRRVGRDMGLLAAAAMVAASPHYPWYFAWLAVPAVLAPSAWLLWLSTGPLLLFLDPIAGDRFLWPALVYVPAGALLLGSLLRARTPGSTPRTGDVGCPLQAP